MKKLIPILLVLAFVAGLPQTARSENQTPKKVEILTAFDVAALMDKGSSAAEIVKLLCEQRGVDRESAPIKGKSDQQAIYYLLTYAKPKGRVPDLGKTVIHKAQGDTALKGGQFEKAATEYSLAINYSSNDFEPYKTRADSYLQYLATKPATSPVAGQEENKPASSKNERSLLCNSIYNDYYFARVLNNIQVQACISQMDRLREKMQELRDKNDPSVTYKRKSYENILNMRLLQQIYYRQREHHLAEVNISKAQTEYNTLCADEEAVRKNLIRLERDKTRDGKWVKFGENADETYFYDKSNLVKSKGNVTVWFLKENTYDEKSHQLSKLTLDCKKKTFATTEFSGYDGDGKQVMKKTYKNSNSKGAAPGTAEAQLLGAICK